MLKCGQSFPNNSNESLKASDIENSQLRIWKLVY